MKHVFDLARLRLIHEISLATQNSESKFSKSQSFLSEFQKTSKLNLKVLWANEFLKLAELWKSYESLKIVNRYFDKPPAQIGRKNDFNLLFIASVKILSLFSLFFEILWFRYDFKLFDIVLKIVFFFISQIIIIFERILNSLLWPKL